MGGTQFNGLALVHELVRAGHDVTVCNRGRTEADLPPSVERLVADRTDHERLREVLGGSEWDCVHDVTAYHPEDVEIMLELFGGNRIGHYVFASSTVTYATSDVLPITEDFPDDRGPDQNQYGLHKLLCEDRLFAAHADHGFPATSVPFSMVVGPHNSLPDRELRVFARLRAGRPVLVPGDGETLLQVGHVDDQARALEQMMGREITFGRRTNLTGHQAVTRAGYVETIADVVGVAPDVRFVPAQVMEDLWTGRRSLGTGQSAVRMDVRGGGGKELDPARMLLAERFRIASTLVQALAPNLHWWNRSVVFSIDRLRTDIGWEPQHDLESMMGHTYEWFCRAGLDRADTYDWTAEDELLADLEGQYS